MEKSPIKKRADLQKDEQPLEESLNQPQGGLEVNSFDIPAKKRKLNSTDDLVSNPIKSPSKETKNKTALDQESLDFEVSRGAENVEDGQEITFSNFLTKSVANISTNAKKLEEETLKGANNIENLSNQDEESCIPKSSANSVESFSTNSKKLEESKNKTGLNQEIEGFETSKGANDIVRKRKLPTGKELPNSNKSPKYSNLTKTQVALNCETLATLARKRKINSADSYPRYHSYMR